MNPEKHKTKTFTKQTQSCADCTHFKSRKLHNFGYIWSKLPPSRICDIAATNRTEITDSLHMQFYRKLERNKNGTEKCDKNCTKNRMCKRALMGAQASRALSFQFLA